MCKKPSQSPNQPNSLLLIKVRFKWYCIFGFDPKQRAILFPADFNSMLRVWLNAWKTQKVKQNWSRLTVPPCLCFVKRWLMFRARLEVMASAYRLCRVTQLLLLQRTVKKEHARTELYHLWRQTTWTEDASMPCRDTADRKMMFRLGFRCRGLRT